jgi:hypothetical protein
VTKLVLASLSLPLFLTACRSEVVREPILPPADLYADCAVMRHGDTFGAVIESLVETIECERADNAALAEWVERGR